MILCPLIVKAQGQGIFFSQNLSWKEILQKAQTERKYIFVDCYATWCGPCKMMDNEVYSNDSVGNFMNDKFICVKMQMDTTGHDSKEIQQWYGTANEFVEKYSVRAYPSFLFFGPDGLIVHKEIGARSPNGFLEAALAAMNPHASYYSLLSKYERGNLAYADMANLANIVYKLGEDSMAFVIAKDYVHHYLDSLTEGLVWTKETVNFMVDFRSLINSSDHIFQLWFHDKRRIDSLVAKSNYADGLINYMVYKDDVEPKIDTAVAQHREPKWKEIKKSIQIKYNKKYLNYSMFKGRMTFYEETKDWDKYTKYMAMYYENLGIREMPVSISIAHLLNNKAYEVCLHTNKKKYLHTALLWVNRAVEIEGTPDAAALDTKANIMYKLGNYKEGISLERQAMNLNPRDKEIQENLSKMQKGLSSTKFM